MSGWLLFCNWGILNFMPSRQIGTASDSTGNQMVIKYEFISEEPFKCRLFRKCATAFGNG